MRGGPAGNALTLLMPGPLQSRMAWRWVRAMAADFALVALNWLLIGAAQVPLRRCFPMCGLFDYDGRAPVSLLGIACLHAALITLMGYTEGLVRGGERSAAAGPNSRQVSAVGDDVCCASPMACRAPVGEQRLVLRSGIVALWRAAGRGAGRTRSRSIARRHPAMRVMC